MDLLKDLNLDRNHVVPLYVQIVENVENGISRGQIKMDDKLPSINVFSKGHNISRDTVEKAYNILKNKKIIVGRRGKGVYINKAEIISKINVLFLIDILCLYKIKIFNSYIENIEGRFQTDFEIYDSEHPIFMDLIKKNINAYDYYVIMPHFKNCCFERAKFKSDFLSVSKDDSRGKLVIIDDYKLNADGEIIEMYQDLESDIYNALKAGLKKMRKYNRLNLVMPESCPYLEEVYHGFVKFCNEQSLDFILIDNIEDSKMFNFRDLFIVIDDEDLFRLINVVKIRGLVLGSDLGIISYNETPFKRLLGISVVSTDYEQIGKTLGDILIHNKSKKVKNPFSFIDRTSF